MSISEKVNNSVMGLIEMVSGDTSSICVDASSSTLFEWRSTQISKGVALGGGAAAIPIAGYLTLPADLAGTLRIMHRAATGMTYLKLGYADDDSFAGILAVWSGAVTLDNEFAKQMAAKTMATSASMIGGKVGIKLSIEAFSIAANALVAKKLGNKVAAKVTSKIVQKLTVKASTRWIPILSALASGGVNWWFVSGICDATEKYCDFIQKNSTDLIDTTVVQH